MDAVKAERVAQVVEWYRQLARPFLEQHAADRVPGLDDQAKRLADVADRTRGDEVSVCFLGAAGVGKSTLLNALVDRTFNVLPQGGIGALTAQATEVRSAERPYLRAKYSDPKTLRGILLNLEKVHETSLRGSVPDLDVAQSAQETAAPTEPDVERGMTIAESYQRQLRLIVQGDQRGPIELPYLLDALRAGLGLQPRWGTAVRPEDEERVRKLRRCVEASSKTGVHYEVAADSISGETFRSEIFDHASGSIAPLILRLEVGWSSDILRDGVVFVDLPGIGVMGDEYQAVTEERVRDARAIVLVVDQRGVTEGSGDLLRTTGFLSNLLHEAGNPKSEPVTLALVMVQVDTTAEDAWRNERQLKGPTTARKWTEHFTELRRKGCAMLRAQIQDELKRIAADGPEETRADREAAVAKVLEHVVVHAVSAPQYRLMQLNDEEAPPRIKSIEESGIPGLANDLHNVALDHRTRTRERLASATREFAEYVASTIDLIQAVWEQDVRAEKEADELRRELETFLRPLQRELETRNGAFREFLRNGTKAEIKTHVAGATESAQKDIGRYLRKLDDLHWATLRATVRRGGVHERGSDSLRIDLPTQLAHRFEDPVAIVWSKEILATIRTRTRELGDDYVALVGDVVGWAREREARVPARVVEALHEQLKAQTRGLATVGREAVDDLKKRVQQELHKKLDEKIRELCAEFVRKRRDQGEGTKARILDLLKTELPADIAEAGRAVVTRVLLANYGDVEKEIGDRLAEYSNPLEQARDALVRSHEDGVRRSDAQKRRRVLDAAAEIRAAMPELAS